MRVSVSFYSYLKDLVGCTGLELELKQGATLGELFEELKRKFPKLAAMEKSILMAVGVDYQDRAYTLRDKDEVSFFPPVQGG